MKSIISIRSLILHTNVKFPCTRYTLFFIQENLPNSINSYRYFSKYSCKNVTSSLHEDEIESNKSQSAQDIDHDISMPTVFSTGFSQIYPLLTLAREDPKVISSAPLYKNIIIAPKPKQSKEQLGETQENNLVVVKETENKTVSSIEVTNNKLILHFETADNPMFQFFCKMLENFEAPDGWKELMKRELELRVQHKALIKELSGHEPSDEEIPYVLQGLVPKQTRNLTSIGGGFIVELDRENFMNYIEFVSRSKGRLLS